jgi:hypothetical protein
MDEEEKLRKEKDHDLLLYTQSHRYSLRSGLHFAHSVEEDGM